jgi:hypothetical protein
LHKQAVSLENLTGLVNACPSVRVLFGIERCGVAERRDANARSPTAPPTADADVLLVPLPRLHLRSQLQEFSKETGV